MDEEVTTDPYGLDTEEAPAELDSLARRPENAIDAADVVDGVLILKRHDGRELRIGAGENGGAPDGGGSSGTLTVIPVEADRALLPSDIGCLLDAVGSTPITLDATDLSEFEEGQTFSVCGVTVNSAMGLITGQVVQPFVIARFFGVLLAAPAPMVPPVVAPTSIGSRDDTGTITSEVATGVQATVASTHVRAKHPGSEVYMDLYANDTGDASIGMQLVNWAGGGSGGGISISSDAAQGSITFSALMMILASYSAEGYKLAFFGKSPVSQPAHPTTIEEVIALLTALGLCQ